MKKRNVIVIGAGIAGLAAGRALAEAGARVTILESRSRVGGRIHTVHAQHQTFELGAEFVHGVPPELWQIIREANLRTEELQGTYICSQGGDFRNCGQQWERDFDLIEQLKQWRKPDCSFADYLDQNCIEGERRKRLISYIEGFNAADHRLIGVASLGKQQAAEDDIEGDKRFRLCEGYSQVPEFVAEQFRSAGGNLLLGTHVRSVAWKPGEVQLSCATDDKSERFSADCAVVTLPLGVLQSGSVKFFPEPEDILQTAKSARMGQVRRVELLFRERFWARSAQSNSQAQLEDLSFLFALDEIPSTWWTRFPARNGCLTAWVGGPRAGVLVGFDAATLGRRSCDVLSRLFHFPTQQMEELLAACYSHDWRKDTLSMGAYSYLPAGSIAAPERMCEPVDGTLYFAGEHTDTTGHWGTVHAALRSGLRAAEQILQG